jgi:hypothetical protein
MKRARIAGMHAHMIATSNSRRDQIPTGTKSSALVSAGHVKRIPLSECTGWVGGTVESDRFYEPEDTNDRDTGRIRPVSYRRGRKTYTMPTANMIHTPNRFSSGMCRFHRVGIGIHMTPTSRMILIVECASRILLWLIQRPSCSPSHSFQ